MARKSESKSKSRSGLRSGGPVRAKSAARVPSVPSTRHKAGPTARSRAITLTLEAECTLTQAPALRETLLGLLGHDGPVTIEADATQRIDATALELLVAFVRERRAAGRELSWNEGLAVIGVAARRIGLDEALQLQAPQARRA